LFLTIPRNEKTEVKNMGKITCGLILVLVAFGTAFGQMTPEQLKLQEEFLRQRQASTDPTQSTLIEQYKSPVELNNQSDSFYNPTGGSVPPAVASADTKNSQVDSGDELKIFGYNLFDGSAETFSPILEASPPPDYKLGPGDNVLVNIWGRVDMQLDLTIDREGKVFIPKVGEISAWGITLDQFKELIGARLSAIYSGYEFSVTLGKIRRIKVFVYGEVKRPGGYTISSLATLFNALYLAGGPTATGSLRSIRHLRSNSVLAQIDLYRFLISGDNSQDSKLESGDVIFVPVCGPLVKITGEVKRSAIYELAGNEKITDLIALAGGATSEAFLEMVSLDRVSKEDSRFIEDVNLSEKLKDSDPQAYAKSDLTLKDGDRLVIASIYDHRKNTVKLTGNVKHPGVFGLTDSMRVSDLVGHGEQFKRDTYTRRANLFRTFPDQSREVYSVNLDEILSGVDSTNYYLIDKDSLQIYSQNDIRRDMKVTISGAVKNPGVYEYFENMRLSDLIFLGGNPLKQTYLLQAEIARVVPGNPAQIIHANIDKVLNEKDTSEDILLAEDDIVFIRTIPRWRLDNNVNISGEVMFPGTYEINMEGEKLSDLIKRCGGFTPDAFPKGIVYERPTISEQVEKRQARNILASTELTILDSLNRPLPKLDQTLDIKGANRIVINSDEALNKPGCPDDIVLQGGDQIYIPPKPAGIQVLGAVAFNGTVVYKKGEKIKYFIKASGGFSNNADKGQTRLAKADGRVLSGGQAFGAKVESGDMVIVPQQIKRDKSWIRSTTSIAAIASTVLSAYLIINGVR
jgi:protein involved in polysaccharide export with SLBB domain